jgi:hypothetical protein
MAREEGAVVFFRGWVPFVVRVTPVRPSSAVCDRMILQQDQSYDRLSALLPCIVLYPS